MKFIQLTLLAEIEVLVNVEMIGHIYPQTEMIKGKEKGYTQICLVTNNNGGMKVKESIYEILELINN